MKIAMVASEANPLCKTGGLADVVYSLSKELVILGEEVSVVLPFYKTIKDKPGLKLKRLGSYDVYLSWRKQTADLFLCYVDGIAFYLVGNDYYFGREDLYGYDDDGERFAFFTLAARSLFPFLSMHVDVIHVHDWQVGMLPTLVREQSRDLPSFAGTKFVMTLHNEAFKGLIDRYFLNHFYGLDDILFDDGRVRFDGMVSTLKAGIIYADEVVAVSPNHAQELLSPGDPMRLDGVLALKKDHFQGIRNGIDLLEFNPAEDPLIGANYDSSSFVEGKKTCKERLLKTSLLPVSNAPVFGLVSRLTSQKGVDLVIQVAKGIFDKGGKLTVLGSGEYELEQAFESLRYQHPESMAIYRGYNNQLAHDIYAGSDFFLMPSLFEPCGIGQMIAQHYGSLPICRKVGGLTDTITPYDDGNLDATGFLFDEYSGSAFWSQIETAFQVYANPKVKNALVKNAMDIDYSWKTSAEAYLALYRR